MKPLYSTPIAFRPMKEGPAGHHWSGMKSYKMHLKIMQTSKGPYLRVSHTIAENPMEDGVQWIKPPYRPGEKCYVPEAWRPECPTKGTYKGFLGTGYKDGTFRLTGWPNGFEAYPNGKWRSPVTMPQWAARRFVTVVSCEPVRIEDVTEEDCIGMGVDSSKYGKTYRFAFLFDWHKRHPGKWAWRVESEEETIGTN